MKVLFVARHSGYITRNYDSVVRALAERRHRIHFVFITLPNKAADNSLIDQLQQDYCGLSYSEFAAPGRNAWTPLLSAIRSAADFLRYFDPVYRDAPKLKARFEKRIPWVFGWMNRVPEALAREPVRSVLWRLFAWIESQVPSEPEYQALIHEHDPDVVLVTPMLDSGPTLLDIAKAAMRQGRKIGLCVASWDNLTNKGIIQIRPDRVFVWNDFQVEEAIKLHGIPRSSVRATGAPLFDRWFAMEPSTSREAFCRKIGFDPSRPIVLYVCSSVFIARNEVAFIRRWLKGLRQYCEQNLAQANVIVRPHPNNTKQWHDVSLADFGDVAIWPALGAVPIYDDTRADYFDSIYHSAAIVGINTTAQVESGILDKQVFTILDDDFKETQCGTLHFRYLTDVGNVSTARSLPEHYQQLAKSIQNGPPSPEKGARFVEAFVRPHGLLHAATDVMVDEIEAFGATEAKRTAPYPERMGLATAWLVYLAAWLARATEARNRQKADKWSTAGRKAGAGQPPTARGAAVSTKQRARPKTAKPAKSKKTKRAKKDKGRLAKPLAQQR